MAGSKIILTAIVVLVILVGVSAYAAYYYYGQLNDSNAAIQKAFTEREFNYTIVLTVNESGCNCGNLSICDCIVAISFPALQNITLTPDGEAQNVSGVQEINKLPSEPLNLTEGLTFLGYIVPVAFGYNFTSSNFNLTEVPNGDGTILYYSYTGQVNIVYPIDSTTLTFNYIGWQDNQTTSLLDYEVIPLF
jgi:hypothetical protein